jgi:AmmeMemoRadiSam system protein A
MNEVLLSLARASIKSHFGEGKIDTDALIKEYPQLEQKGASFVTLTLDGHLRGCIGSIIAHRTLLEDIIHNARAAAFNDPRFRPLGQEELSGIRIEVSLLSDPQVLEYEDGEDLKSKIRPGIDGVVLRMGSKQSTFLPQVWEDLPEFEVFFSHLCQKAGLNANCFESHPEIYTYQVKKVKES